MTIKEVTTLLKNSKNKEAFEDLKVLIGLPHINFEIELNGFLEIFSWVKKQAAIWDRHQEDLPSHLAESKSKIKMIYSEMENWLKRNEEVNFRQNWNQINQYFSEYKSGIKFTADSLYTEFLVEVHKIGVHTYRGAINYLFTNSLNFRNTEEFTGALMAYEIKFSTSALPTRRKVEKKSVGRLRSEFENFYEQTQIDVSEFFEKAKTEKKSAEKLFDEVLEEKKAEFKQWFEKSKASEIEYNTYNLERAKQLETMYSSQLKIKGPAKYWKDRALELKNQGDKWRNWLIVSCIIAILSLGFVLFFISDGTLKDLFDKSGSAIRWSIVFITFVSFLAYGVRTFAKLMFSSYHLHRDAEEREQLTFVYLALIKEQGVEDSERELIMQSIFSRADSGLLRDDSSPTMPGSSALEKIINK